MADVQNEREPKKFEPKNPPVLEEPKRDPMTPAELARYDGTNLDQPIYVAIMGDIFNVSGNSAYATKGAYHVFAGKDASRALAKSSLKLEDCVSKFDDLDDKEKKVLKDWHIFFSKRYNIVGVVQE